MKIDKNLTVLVTGGSSGLGLALVRLLAEAGAKVIIADLNQKLGERIASQTGATFLNLNVTNEQQVKQMFASIKQKFGRLDVVVNSAGISVIGKTLSSSGKILSAEKTEKVMKVNVVGTFNVSKYAAKMMSEQDEVNGERGVIVMVSSVLSQDGTAAQVAYAASKGAINGMVLPMARDLGKFKIRVMAIAPGLFDTPMTEGASEEALKFMFPLSRMGRPSDFAIAVKSVIENPDATGGVWRIDGGLLSPNL